MGKPVEEKATRAQMLELLLDRVLAYKRAVDDHINNPDDLDNLISTHCALEEVFALAGKIEGEYNHG